LTPKETILKYICNMDTEMLSTVLDDNRTYQEATKSVFIGKLEDVFREYKSKGDTELIPSLGYCGSEECTNQGCKGYSFFGNVSNEYLSLILEEKNGEVTDIYHCLFMMPEKGYWELSNQITYTIHTDDKANFVPDINYSITQQKCKEAINDLQKSFNGRITDEDASYWLSKHKPLKDETDNYILHGGFIKEFRLVYLDIESFYNLSSKEKQAHCAVKDFYLVSSNDDEAVLSWLIKYEEFGQDLEYFSIDLTFDLNEAIQKGFVQLKRNNRIHFIVDQYSKIPEFLNIFSERYWSYVKSISNTGNDEVTRDYYEPSRLYLKEYDENRKNSKK
jgi:hypothetical protein